MSLTHCEIKREKNLERDNDQNRRRHSGKLVKRAVNQSPPVASKLPPTDKPGCSQDLPSAPPTPRGERWSQLPPPWWGNAFRSVSKVLVFQIERERKRESERETFPVDFTMKPWSFGAFIEHGGVQEESVLLLRADAARPGRCDSLRCGVCGAQVPRRHFRKGRSGRRLREMFPNWTVSGNLRFF